MKRVQVHDARAPFRVVAETARSQAATMVLRPGEATGGSDNVHPESDQWLYVVSGAGRAVVRGRASALEAGTLLLIEAGETHELRNTGTVPLVTVNVYAPAAY